MSDPFTPSPIDTPNDRQTLNAHLITGLVEQRLRNAPAIRAALEEDADFPVVVGQARAHERDARGRNWDILAFRTGFGHWPQCHAEFRAIVDELRLTIDLV